MTDRLRYVDIGKPTPIGVTGERWQILYSDQWCEHNQPEQLTKTRYFGGWCSRKRTQYQLRCCRLLGLSQEIDVDEVEMLPSSSDSLVGAASDDDSLPQCPACASRLLRLVGSTSKPSWANLLIHLDSRCPSWYAEQEHQEFCGFLEREYGIGYEDWCLEMRIESPMRAAAERMARQIYLPGLYPECGFAIEPY